MYSSNGFVHLIGRREEPLPRANVAAEPVSDCNIRADRIEEQVQQPFELRPVDVVEVEAGDDRGWGEKESRIVDRIDDASMDIASGHADLHHATSVISDSRVLRQRARHIDMTRGHVGIVGLLLE